MNHFHDNQTLGLHWEEFSNKFLINIQSSTQQTSIKDLLTTCWGARSSIKKLTYISRSKVADGHHLRSDHPCRNQMVHLVDGMHPS
jgi:hypothetical protein